MVDAGSGRRTPMIAEKYWKIIKENSERLNSAIVYDRDYSYNFFGFKVN